MAPFSLLAAGASLLAKSFSVLTATSSLTRCTSVLPAAYVSSVKFLTSETSGPPKKPLNGYMRYVMHQKPVVMRQNPEFKLPEIIRMIAQQWRMLNPEQKRPFNEASMRAMEQFKVDLRNYQAQLTPAQIQEQALERSERLAKRQVLRRKRELTSMGKPKRPRSAFNIFMSEHFDEARGATITGKMKSLLEDWTNLTIHQQRAYMQLAEDDKIRYKSEMMSWEDHMLEIGREDLVREKTLSAKRKSAAVAKMPTKNVTTKGKKAAATGKSVTTRKTTKGSSSKTIRTIKKT